MDSYIDVSFHVILSLAAGYIAWRLFGQNSKENLVFSLIAALIAGVAIDLDHFIDYFLVFGFDKFNYNYFINGEYFLRTGRSFILFHGFEYALLFGLISRFSKNKKVKMIFLSLALGMLLHIFIDVLFFSIPFKFYSLTYRILNNFNLQLPVNHIFQK